MTIYEIYGINSNDLNISKLLTESILGVVFLEKESAYQGGVYYFHGDKNAEHYILKRNIDPFDGEAVEFPEYPILLYANRINNLKIFRDRIEGKGMVFSLLKHEDLK